MLNEQMRKLVEALDKTHNNYVQEVVKHGGINLNASKLNRDYKELTREIIKVDIVKEKNKY